MPVHDSTMVAPAANNGARQFDPSKHLTRIKFRGGPEREYLPVAARVMWLRALHPDAVVETWCISDDVGVRSTWGARVTLPSGASATGFGSRSKADNRGDYFEAGETRALGRALAHLGIATEYIDPDEMDEGRDDGQVAAVDSGRERKQPQPLRQQPAPQRPLQQAPPPEPTPAHAGPRRLTGEEAGRFMVACREAGLDENAVRHAVHARLGHPYHEMSTREAKVTLAELTAYGIKQDGTGRWVIDVPPAEDDRRGGQ